MDNQTRLEKKREQHLCRETSARLDHFISDYVQHKYANIYAEAKEYHDHLRSIYTTKHNLTKTTEFILWKKQIQEHPQKSPTQGRANREHIDNMELKIPLIEGKKTKTTTTAIETSSSINSSNNEIAEGNIAPTEGTMEGIETSSSINSSNNEIAEGNIAPTEGTMEGIETSSSINSSNNEIAEGNIAPTEGTIEVIETSSSINSNSNNEIAEETIAPSINEEIPTDLLEEIITELSADSNLNDIFTDFDFDFDFEMLGCNINGHELEDQLL